MGASCSVVYVLVVVYYVGCLSGSVQVPGYGFYKLWVGLLWPWFKMGSEGGDTGNEKARKKQERKHGKRIIKYS